MEAYDLLDLDDLEDTVSGLLDRIVFSDWMNVPADQSTIIAHFTEGKMFQIETNYPVDRSGIR